MNNIDYFLACLSEECGEVIQVVGKSHRFGICDVHPVLKEKNHELIRKEFHDILATYEMVMEELGLTKDIDRGLVILKKNKVLNLMRERTVHDEC